MSDQLILFFTWLGAGLVNRTECYLVSATGEYPIEITAGVVKFPEPPSFPEIVSWANNTAVTAATIEQFGLRKGTSPWIRTTLSGIAAVANAQFASQESIVPYSGDGVSLTTVGFGSVWFASTHIKNYEAWKTGIDMAPAWNDPRPAIMAGLNNLMVRFLFSGISSDPRRDLWSLTSILTFS